MKEKAMQKFFNFMHQMHGVILTDIEIYDLLEQAKNLQKVIDNSKE